MSTLGRKGNSAKRSATLGWNFLFSTPIMRYSERDSVERKGLWIFIN